MGWVCVCVLCACNMCVCVYICVCIVCVCLCACACCLICAQFMCVDTPSRCTKKDDTTQICTKETYIYMYVYIWIFICICIHSCWHTSHTEPTKTMQHKYVRKRLTYRCMFVFEFSYAYAYIHIDVPLTPNQRRRCCSSIHKRDIQTIIYQYVYECTYVHETIQIDISHSPHQMRYIYTKETHICTYIHMYMYTNIETRIYIGLMLLFLFHNK